MAVIHDVMPAFELFQPATIGDVVTLLNRYGADAWIMAGGMDSFDWLKDRIKRPKVVIDLSQVESLRGIKALNPQARVIVVSALEQKNILKEAFQLGANDFIVKPFDRHNLVETLEKVFAPVPA